MVIKKKVKLSDLKLDPVGDELSRSAQMKPYVDFFKAIYTDKGLDAAAERVAGLELNDRYIWRVASALQWALGDFDSETAKLDWEFMSEEERTKVAGMLYARKYQLGKLFEVLNLKGAELGVDVFEMQLQPDRLPFSN